MINEILRFKLIKNLHFKYQIRYNKISASIYTVLNLLLNSSAVLKVLIVKVLDISLLFQQQLL